MGAWPTGHDGLNLLLPREKRAKSAAIRLRDTGHWKAQFYGAEMLKFSSMINRFRRSRFYANLLNI